MKEKQTSMPDVHARETELNPGEHSRQCLRWQKYCVSFGTKINSAIIISMKIANQHIRIPICRKEQSKKKKKSV